MLEYSLRFLAGGIAVSAFAALGDALRPKSFGHAHPAVDQNIAVPAQDEETVRPDPPVTAGLASPEEARRSRPWKAAR